MQASLPKRDVVLLGVGHTNAHVLRMWRMKPIPDARLTCISNYSVATYSGMLPGVLAGQYRPERMEIDLVRLCAAAGARLIVGDVTGFDLEQKQVCLRDRTSVAYDLLSIGVGSVPRMLASEFGEEVVSIKPMQTILTRLETQVRRAVRQLRGDRDHSGQPLRVAIVGAGAGGVEVAFCIPRRLKEWLGGRPFQLTLINAHDSLMPGVTPRTARRTRALLEQRKVSLELGSRVEAVQEGRISLASGKQLEADLVLWATSATAPPVLGLIDLPKDDAGFLLTRPTLQSTGDKAVFAVGDSGTLVEAATPKAGVYAVRQGPVLWRNLQRALRKEKLEAYQPQKKFLKLFNTGDGRGIGEYYATTLEGSWVWHLKNAIDGKFMDKFQDYQPMEMSAGQDAGDAPPVMRCAGCGGKVGGSVLSRVLERLDVPRHEAVHIGLDEPDDAAVIRSSADRVALTVDFFSAPLDDPYLVGRVAALNAASDLFALGAQPIAALATAVIPVGSPRKQEQLLYELLAGGLDEFRKMGATLVGGHTIEGPQLLIGYTMMADQHQRPKVKGDLSPGDLLILTKPVGSGVLLAGQMQALCRAEWMQDLLHTMLQSNQEAAQAAEQHQVTALTDVTGFGLAGHLLEMLRASRVAATLELADFPLLPGAAELLSKQLESTLAPANRAAESEIRVLETFRGMPEYSVMFDPQTSGGLLLGVRPERAEALIADLSQRGFERACVIGEIREEEEPRQRIEVHACGDL